MMRLLHRGLGWPLRAACRPICSAAGRLPLVGVIDMENKDGIGMYVPQSADEKIEQHVLDGVAKVVYTGAPSIEAVDPALLSSFSAVLLRRCAFGQPQLSLMPNLTHILRMGAGYDNVDLVACSAASVGVSNCPDAWTEEVADHTLALLLALLRRTPELTRHVSEGHGWTRHAGLQQLGLRRLRGLRLGIVGLGRIGTAVAQRCRPFGFELAFFDPHQPAGVEKGVGGLRRADSFRELLTSVDVLTFHCPLTSETRHMLDGAALATLPPMAGIRLVNTARGGVLDESALLVALEDGRVGGAALDSLEAEPAVCPALRAAAQASPLLLTPHAAFYSDEAFQEMRLLAAREIARVLSGERAHYRVN